MLSVLSINIYFIFAKTKTNIALLPPVHILLLFLSVCENKYLAIDVTHYIKRVKHMLSRYTFQIWKKKIHRRSMSKTDSVVSAFKTKNNLRGACALWYLMYVKH